MTQHLTIGTGTIAYELTGQGPLVVLAHGIGDSRDSYRFLAPPLVAAGYRVANVDLRGCGESSTGWAGYSRTDIAADLVSLVRHLGGPAVLIGHSISGGAATIAAATAPELFGGIVELAPFTRKQSFGLGDLLRHKSYRTGMRHMAGTMLLGSLKSWTKYLQLAVPAKPADWDADLARIQKLMGEPARMKVLQAMCKTNPGDAGAQLGNVRCPVLVVEGTLDPDWADPKAEGEAVVAELPTGLGELAVIEGAGHYPHRQTPDQLLTLVLPFLARTVAHA